MTLGKKRSNVLAEHVVCKKDYPVSPVTTSIFSESEKELDLMILIFILAIMNGTLTLVEGLNFQKKQLNVGGEINHLKF